MAAAQDAIKPSSQVSKAPLRRIVLCVISGLLAALAFSTHSTGWVIWFAFIPWLYALFSQPASGRSYAFHSWIFGMSFYIGIVHWLKELHPLTWLGGVTELDSLLIVYGGIFGISLVVSLWTTLLGALLGWLKPTGWRQIVYPALLWMLMEYCQQLGEISLPWARLAVSQYQNLWLLQIVPHTGHLVISGLIVAVNAALTIFIMHFAADPKPKAYWHYPGFKALVALIALIGADSGYGAYRMLDASSAATPANDADSIFVGVVQGSIPQGEKWGGTPAEVWAKIANIEKIYLDLSHELIKEKGSQASARHPGLIIWPESAVPVFPRYHLDYQAHDRKLAQEAHSYFLTGGFDKLPDETVKPKPDEKPPELTYNAAMLADPDPVKQLQWYYKRQLVPFGEYFPYRTVIGGIPLLGGMITSLNPMNEDTTPGRKSALFDTVYGKLGTLVCFESVYSPVAQSSVRDGANLLVIITNDGWYKDAIALYQHLGHAVLRALENDRYVVRAGNTGISAFIDNHGQILAETKPLDRTAMGMNLPKSALRSNLTLFTRYGDWPIWPALLFLLIAELLRRTIGPMEEEEEGLGVRD